MARNSPQKAELRDEQTKRGERKAHNNNICKEYMSNLDGLGNRKMIADLNLELEADPGGLEGYLTNQMRQGPSIQVRIMT